MAKKNKNTRSARFKRWAKAFFLRRQVCPFCKEVFHGSKNTTKLIEHKSKKVKSG